MQVEGIFRLTGLAAVALGWLLYRFQGYRTPLSYWCLVIGCIASIGIGALAYQQKQVLLNALQPVNTAIFFVPIVARAVYRLKRNPQVVVERYMGDENLVVRVYALESLIGPEATVFWRVQILVGSTLCVTSTLDGVIGLLK